MSAEILYTVGEVAVITMKCRNEAGALQDPASLTVAVLAPDASTSSFAWPGPNVTKTSTGTFTCEYPIAMAGKHRGKATTTGAATPGARNFLLVARA